MKAKKSLKKLDLSMERISTLTPDEAKNVKGGLFSSHFICTQSKADVGCTSHSKCTSGSTDITILCIEF